MKRHLLTYIAALLLAACGNNKVENWELRTPDGSDARTVSIDTMEMSNPFIIFDKSRLTYYMTGDGGYVWKSRDLHKWNGPYNVLSLDTLEWMGAHPQITAPEIHKYQGAELEYGCRGAACLYRSNIQTQTSDCPVPH